MSLIRKFAGETAIYGSSSILGRLLQYVILTPYLTRVFADAEYGVIQIVYTYAGILIVLFTYRMETAFFRFGSKEGQMDRAFSTASWSLLATTLAFVGLGIVFLAPLSEALNFPNHPEYLLLLLAITALDTFAALPFARLRLENRPLRFAAARILQILLNIAFLFLLLEYWQVEDRIGAVFWANLLANGLVLVLLLPVFFRVQLQFDAVLMRKMLGYAMPLVVVGVAAVVNQLIALPLMETWLPGNLEENRAQAGIYGAALKLAVLMNLFTQAFNYAAEPFFFRNADRSDAREQYAHIARLFTLAGCLAFLGVTLYMDLIKHLIGPEFRAGIGIVPIVLMAYLFLGLYYNFSAWFKLTDRTWVGAVISLTGVAITLGVNYWTLPRWGYSGAAWAALACYGFMALASYWSGHRVYPIPYRMDRMLWYVTWALVVFGLSQLLQTERLWADLGVNTLLLALYVGVVYWLDGAYLRRLIAR